MSTTTPAGHASDTRILSLIGVGHGMSHLYYMVLPPIFVQLREAFGVTYAELGLALALMSLASALVQVPIGFLVDRLGARVVLAVGFLVVSVTTALMGLTTSFWQLMILCVVSGLGNAVFHPTDYAILNSSVSAERMGRAFSIHTFSGQLGTASAPVIMIALSQAFGWRSALVICGIAGLAATAIVVSQWSAMRDEQIARPTNSASTGSAESATASAPGPTAALATILSPGMLMFFVFFTAMSMMQTGMQSFAATALVYQHGTPLAIANLALSAFLFTSAAGVLIGGELADRAGRHDLVAAIVFSVSAAACLVFAWVSLPAALLVVLMSIVGLGQGATRPARDLMLRAATPKGATGSVFGFVTSGIAVGSALAPIPLGWLLDIGQPALVFYCLAVFMGLALASMYLQQHWMPAARP